MAVSPRKEGAGAAELVPRRRVLDLLGLAARAGGIVIGTDSVRQAAREDRVFRVILAEDAAPGQQGKVLPLLEARQVPFHSLFTRYELGAAIGRGPASAIGFTTQSFARRVGELLAALPSMRD